MMHFSDPIYRTVDHDRTYRTSTVLTSSLSTSEGEDESSLHSPFALVSIRSNDERSCRWFSSWWSTGDWIAMWMWLNNGKVSIRCWTNCDAVRMVRYEKFFVIISKRLTTMNFFLKTKTEVWGRRETRRDDECECPISIVDFRERILRWSRCFCSTTFSFQLFLQIRHRCDVLTEMIQRHRASIVEILLDPMALFVDRSRNFFRRLVESHSSQRLNSRRAILVRSLRLLMEIAHQFVQLFVFVVRICWFEFLMRLFDRVRHLIFVVQGVMFVLEEKERPLVR